MRPKRPPMQAAFSGEPDSARPVARSALLSEAVSTSITRNAATVMLNEV